jgi:O-antigen/teichoic acid export membrane protein
LYVLRRRALVGIFREHGITVSHEYRISAELPLLRTLVIPSALFGLGAQPFAWLARALLARGTGGLAEVGVFSIAYSWGAAVLTIPSQITRPAMPILTNLLAHGETATFKRTLRDTLLVAFAAALLVALPVMALSPWIVRAYGPQFASGALVLCSVAFSSVLGSLSAALRSALVARGDVWGQVLQSLLWGVTLIAAFLLLRTHGALGLGLAYNIAFFATLVAQAVVAATALKTGRSPRVAVDLSDPAIGEADPLLEDPEA